MLACLIASVSAVKPTYQIKVTVLFTEKGHDNISDYVTVVTVYILASITKPVAGDLNINTYSFSHIALNALSVTLTCCC